MKLNPNISTKAPLVELPKLKGMDNEKSVLCMYDIYDNFDLSHKFDFLFLLFRLAHVINRDLRLLVN